MWITTNGDWVRAYHSTLAGNLSVPINEPMAGVINELLHDVRPRVSYWHEPERARGCIEEALIRALGNPDQTH